MSIVEHPQTGPAVERRHPLRFVWQMDVDGHFVVGSDEFIELIGPRTTAAFGRLWSEVAAELQLDLEDRIARAVATRDTWSGIVVAWPVDGSSERLPVELSGLPVFDRDRNFRGYRGFGVCRDLARINQLARARRDRPIGFMALPEQPREDPAPLSESAGRPETATETAFAAAVAGNEVSPQDTAFSPQAEAAPQADARLAPRPDSTPFPAVPEDLGAPATPIDSPAAANVVPFRQGAASEARAPSLSAIEHVAFRELAQELTARLRAGREAPTAETRLADGEMVPADAPQVHPAAALSDVAPDAPARERITPDIAAATDGERHATDRHLADLGAVLEAASDGVLLLDRGSRIVAVTQSAEKLLGRAAEELRGRCLPELFAAEDVGPAREQFEGFAASALITRDGFEAATQGHGGGSVPLSVKLTRLGGGRFGAILSDATQLRKMAEELASARREARRATAAKAALVAKLSHEIRTPLNSITGFAEAIMAERFGPISNERYREYLKDIHRAGTHLASLLDDVLDLSKIEAGQLDLAFTKVNLNELTQQCVGIMQPQASRSRIIIRTSLTPALPRVMADERALRQIMLNLISNSIQLTGAGGQVIVSSAFVDGGEAVLRVRDTGAGMSEKDIEAAMQPFRETAIAESWGADGTGLGLRLTKALAEANRAHFSIKSAPNAGTLVEVVFPAGSVAP